MKRSGGIVVLVFVILGFFLSPSSLTAEDISKDIAAFRTQFQLALDTIHKAQAGQTLDMNTLSVSIKKMEKILVSIKKRVKAEQMRKIGVKPSKADEAALRAMMDQVKKEKEQSEEREKGKAGSRALMRQVKKEQEDAKEKEEEKEVETKREQTARLKEQIKELGKMASQVIDALNLK
jgi:hypothetical protein